MSARIPLVKKSVNQGQRLHLALWPLLLADGEPAFWTGFFACLFIFIQQMVAWYDRYKANYEAEKSAKQAAFTLQAVEASRAASGLKIGKVAENLAVVHQLVDGNLGQLLRDLAVVKRRLAGALPSMENLAAADAAERTSQAEDAKIKQIEAAKEKEGDPSPPPPPPVSFH